MDDFRSHGELSKGGSTPDRTASRGSTNDVVIPTFSDLGSVLARISYRRFRFELAARSTLHLPTYLGSTLRGAFGVGLKDAVCVVPHRDCGGCVIRNSCAFPYLFDTPIAAGSQRLASCEWAPRPYVIEPPLESRLTYEAGERLVFDLILVGAASRRIGEVILAFEKLGRTRGLGRRAPASTGASPSAGSRGLFHVTRTMGVAGATAIPIYVGNSQEPHGVLDASEAEAFVLEGADPCPPHDDAVREITLRLLTPTRLGFDRILVKIPEFHIVVRNLLRRVSNLAYFHCGEAELPIDFRGLIAAATTVRLIENATRWHDWARYSGRQDRRLLMGGLVGDATYTGDLTPFLPLLRLGGALHVGKGTVLGLGRYELTGPTVSSS